MPMPRFVLLHHETPSGYERPTHFDLMLEVGAVLRTWALAARPDESLEQLAEALGDHRLAYLELEGPLSGNRGSVRRIDEGTYTVESGRLEADEDRYVVQLLGQEIVGRLELVREPVAGASAPQRWRLCFAAD
ncbi:MAG: hypothetical protein DWQ42_18415 [Planctomycetota bacterium]|nr:MAG: hypothetical protein DWQ42_18415 [Planctomycetota bacterium]REK46666.1 MAG: hypothetical protein DWQ46_06100 [Planctomycetota bacterium]